MFLCKIRSCPTRNPWEQQAGSRLQGKRRSMGKLRNRKQTVDGNNSVQIPEWTVLANGWTVFSPAHNLKSNSGNPDHVTRGQTHVLTLAGDFQNSNIQISTASGRVVAIVSSIPGNSEENQGFKKIRKCGSRVTFEWILVSFWVSSFVQYEIVWEKSQWFGAHFLFLL